MWRSPAAASLPCTKASRLPSSRFFLNLKAAHLAAAGNGGGDPVGIKVAEKVLGSDFAPKEQRPILGVVGVDPLDFVWSEGAASRKQGLAKLVPEILVWPMLPAGPPAAPEAVDDFLVVNAYAAVPRGTWWP